MFAITTRGEHDIPNGAGSLSSPWRRKATLCSRHDAGVVLAGATVEQGTSVAGDVAVGTASWCSRGGDRGVVVGARSCLAASASGQGRRGRRARVAPWARLMPRCARRPRDSEQGCVEDVALGLGSTERLRCHHDGRGRVGGVE